MRTLFVLIFIFFQHSFYGQSTNLDTLYLKLSEAVEDSSKIMILNKIGVHHYYTKTPEKGRPFHEQALELAQKRKYKKQIGKTLYYLGYLDYKKNEDSLAILSFERAKAIYDQIEDADGIVRTYRILGRMARERGEYTASFDYFNRAEIYIPKLPKKSASLGRITLYEIGGLYWVSQDFERAADYYFDYLKWAEEDKDSIDIGFGLRNIGWVLYNKGDLEKSLLYLQRAYIFDSKYSNDGRDAAFCARNLSNCFLDLAQLDSAEWYAIKFHDYFKSIENKTHLSASYQILGKIAFAKKNQDQGFEYLHKALTTYEEIGQRPNILNSSGDLGVYYHQYGNCDKAIALLEPIIKESQQLKKFDFVANAANILAECYEQRGNYNKSIAYYKVQLSFKDSLKIAEESQKLEAFEIQYRAKEKENELQLKETQITFQNQELRRQKMLNWIMGVVAFLILLLAVLIWRMARQRKAANKKLRQLDNAKSRFFTNISHELRTPLTLILAPLEKAIEKVKPKSIKEDLQLAHSNSKKLFLLVNEIMDLSKLESGKMQLKETAVGLEKLLRRIFFSYQSLAEVRGFDLSFRYYLPKDLGVQLDIEKFEKVLNNLLSNAFKYSKSGGVIVLEVSDEKGNLKIEVQDMGKGISKENLEKIFDRFYQIENETEPLQGGTGIGLAYAKEIAHLFGGDLKVESKLDEGSNFILTMPLKKAALKKVISVESEEIFKPIHTKNETPLFLVRNGKPNILIVEDNPEMSKFLVQTLSNQFQCTTAMDGIEALKKLENQKFDLITSDVMMPNMDGFTFLKKVHEREDFSTTPVIMLTARTLEEDKLRGFQLGVDDYLTKPFSTKELIARINNLLKNKAEREQWQLKNNSLDSKEKDEEKPLSFEKKLLKTAEDLVLKNLSNSNFKITELARELNYSQRQVERIMKKMTGFSPVGFVREIRLQKAYELIESRQFATISEVRLEVGMENASYFTKKFQERFGKSPNEL